MLNGWNVTKTSFDHAWAGMEGLWAPIPQVCFMRLSRRCFLFKFNKNSLSLCVSCEIPAGVLHLAFSGGFPAISGIPIIPAFQALPPPCIFYSSFFTTQLFSENNICKLSTCRIQIQTAAILLPPNISSVQNICKNRSCFYFMPFIFQMF